MSARKKNSGRGYDWAGFHRRHRKNSDKSVHAAAEAAPTPPLLDHPLVPTDEPALIETQADVDALCDELAKQSLIAYDTEFIGEQTYIPKLCVVQIGTADRVVLIDALAHVDLGKLWQLLGSDAVTTLVHAGRQDMEPITRFTGQSASGVFDTQIAAGLVGRDYPQSLTSLAKTVLHANLGKGLKFSQWDRRPLTQEQCYYAANDVRYLPALHAALSQELDQRARADWVVAEGDAMGHIDQFTFDVDDALERMRGSGNVSPEQRRVLRELIAWREQASIQQDVPTRSILKDGLLIDLARLGPKKVGRLSTMRGMPRPVVEHFGQAIIDTISRAREMPAIPSPGRDNCDVESLRKHINRVYKKAVRLCDKQDVASALVFNKREVAQLVRAATANRDWPKLRMLSGWRRQVVEQVLDELLQDQQANSGDNGKAPRL